MSEKLNVRNISPLLQMIRNFLLGRKHVPEHSALRYTPLISPRTQPPPNLPDGEAHKLSANHYCKRDGRRESVPPQVLVVATPNKMIKAGTSKDSGPATTTPATGVKKAVTPGKYWKWD